MIVEDHGDQSLYMASMITLTVILILAYSRLEGDEILGIRKIRNLTESANITTWTFKAGLAGAGQSRLVPNMPVSAANRIG